ncbi:ElyC/SanA/YdcF family protein [Pseudomonas sp. F1_0610]|uniref:SanA/YdcF family protein n=1 Tax=Pseudomonas sp. F1_0610 TaxID=3114284 RepID=UPI0039C1BF74
MFRRKLKKYIGISLFCIVFLFIIIATCDRWIVWQAENRTYDSITDIPYHRTALVLGTAQYLKSGYENPYFKFRMDATAELFHAKKISYIVVSGDNSHRRYNEPEDMRQALIQRGIPKQRIYLDYAGFRTLDSVYRMRAIFQQTSFIIISQEFHNQRALYIADYLGIDAIAYNAKDVGTFYGIKTLLREKLARVKVITDRILKVEPKFLGETIKIKDPKHKKARLL